MTIQETLYRRFRQAGMTAQGACATLAQIQFESAFRSTNAEDSKGIADDVYTSQVDSGARTRHQFMHDGIGYGYAQWTEQTRKGRMYDFHRARGKSIGDSETQIQYLLWEMKNYFPNQWKLVISSNNLRDCTWELLDKWENPAEKTKNMENRYQAAQNFFKMFSAIQLDGGSSNSKLTEKEAIQKVLDLAKSEIGYHEKASNASLDSKTANSGSGNWTKYARDLAATSNFYNGNKNGYAWCDVWYDWLFAKCFGAEIGRQMLCQPYNSAGAGCLYSAQYYKQAGRWVKNPQPGDQIFFTYSAGEVSHTGIVESVVSGMVTTIEGNTSDQVARRQYSASSASIYGYGRPRWELASIGFDASTPIDISSAAEILRMGSSGDEVLKLQKQLKKLGYDLGKWGADGDFGRDTYNAVKQFQTDHNIEVDGEVGPETRKALEDALKPKPAPKTEEKQEVVKPEETIPRNKLQIRLLKLDMEGPDVKLAQAALNCWGYTTIVSGIFGKEMNEKVRDFQEKKNLEVDGEIGPETWKKLLEVM